MLEGFDNTNLQGNAGLGKAIAYFSLKQASISVPLTDTQKYDLVVDMEGELQRIQVKTSYRETESGGYKIDLTTTYKDHHEPFDPDHFDALFVVVEDGRLFLIPSEKIEGAKNITVGSTKYNEYELSL